MRFWAGFFIGALLLLPLYVDPDKALDNLRAWVNWAKNLLGG